MPTCSALVALLILAVVAGPATALEFRSVTDELTILYDAPSKDATKRLILTKGYPVEVIITSGGWMRVRDDAGTFAWIEAGRLAEKRTVMVTETVVEARDAPDASAPLVFRAEKGVILEFVGVSGGWAKVRHRDGTIAYIRLGDLWGV